MTPDEQRQPSTAGAAQEAPEDGSATRARRWTYVTTALLILAGIAFLRFAQPFLLPLVLAVLLHFLLRPVVVTLEEMRIPRPLSAALVLIIFLTALGFALSSLQ